MIKRKYSVTILDESWKVLRPDMRLSIIPRTGELVYLEEFTKYFVVIKVIHYLNKKHGIFLIIGDYIEAEKN
jgi:hypothetical protein